MNLKEKFDAPKDKAEAINALTKTMRAVYDALTEDAFLPAHQIVPELREAGVSLSVTAVQKISRELCERGLAESNGHNERPMFRRSWQKKAFDLPPAPKAIESIKPVPVEDRFLAICGEMLDAMAALRTENETLRSGGCTPEELATLREKAQLFDTMKQVFAPK